MRLIREYIKLARIKGLSGKNRYLEARLEKCADHAAYHRRDAIRPTLFPGAVIIESVFNWPGIGRLAWNGMIARDFPVVQGVTLMVATIILLVNLLVDILYAYVDPQIRFQRT